VEGINDFGTNVSHVEAWTVPSHEPTAPDVTTSQPVNELVETNHEFKEEHLVASQ